MKFVNEATAKDTAFIKCFPDDSGVYARVLTETELDTLRVKSRTFNGNEKRTPELMDRRFKILHLQRALSGWEGLEFEDGSPIPFSKEMIKELWEVNPNLMGIIYSCVSSELSFVKAAEEKTPGLVRTPSGQRAKLRRMPGDMGARRAGTALRRLYLIGNGTPARQPAIHAYLANLRHPRSRLRRHGRASPPHPA